MRLYARNQGMQTSNRLLKDDIVSNNIESLDEDTIALYVNALKKFLMKHQ